MGEHPSSVILVQSYTHTRWVSVSLLPIWLLPIWPQKNLHGKERCIKRRWDSSFMSKPTRPTADVSKANVITGYFIIAVAKSPERDAHVADSNIFHTSAVCAEK